MILWSALLKYQFGEAVVIHGLQTEMYNFLEGVVGRHVPRTGRHAVAVATAHGERKTLTLKPTNLFPRLASASTCASGAKSAVLLLLHFFTLAQVRFRTQRALGRLVRAPAAVALGDGDFGLPSAFPSFERLPFVAFEGQRPPGLGAAEGAGQMLFRVFIPQIEEQSGHSFLELTLPDSFFLRPTRQHAYFRSLKFRRRRPSPEAGEVVWTIEFPHSPSNRGLRLMPVAFAVPGGFYGSWGAWALANKKYPHKVPPPNAFETPTVERFVELLELSRNAKGEEVVMRGGKAFREYNPAQYNRYEGVVKVCYRLSFPRISQEADDAEQRRVGALSVTRRREGGCGGVQLGGGPCNSNGQELWFLNAEAEMEYWDAPFAYFRKATDVGDAEKESTRVEFYDLNNLRGAKVFLRPGRDTHQRQQHSERETQEWFERERALGRSVDAERFGRASVEFMLLKEYRPVKVVTPLFWEVVFTVLGEERAEDGREYLIWRASYPFNSWSTQMV